MPTGTIHADTAVCYFLYQRYICHSSGEIFDKYTQTYLPDYPHEGSLQVEVYWPDFVKAKTTLRVVSRAFILTLAFRRCNLPLSLLDRLEVMYIDNDHTNIKLNNLILKYPEGGLEHPSMPGYYYIPGFSRYVINREGNIVSMFLAKRKDTYVPIDKYQHTSMASDSGTEKTVGIHRALALTFIPYRTTVATDVVNHMDGIKSNNSIDNLEWCSQTENTIHSFQHKREGTYGIKRSAIGLKGYNDSRKETKEPTSDTITFKRTEVPGFEGKKHGGGIQVKDLYTGEILEFETGRACAKYFKCSPASVVHAYRSHVRKSIFQGRYVVKNDHQEWPNITKDDIRPESLSSGRPVLAKNTKTGDISEYETAASFIRKHNLRKKVVTSNLKKGSQPIEGDFIFKYKDSPDPWRF